MFAIEFGENRYQGSNFILDRNCDSQYSLYVPN